MSRAEIKFYHFRDGEDVIMCPYTSFDGDRRARYYYLEIQALSLLKYCGPSLNFGIFVIERRQDASQNHTTPQCVRIQMLSNIVWAHQMTLKFKLP